MQLLAQRGANVPFVGTGVPTVSFSALSSNSIYSMIITYGGGGGSTDLLGWSTNIAAANSISNKLNMDLGGNVTVSGTLIGGSLQTTLGGSATIFDHTSFAGASAGTTIWDSLSVAGTGVAGPQWKPNDVQQPTNIMFRVDYPILVATNYVATDFIPEVGRIKYCYSNYVIYAVSPVKTNLISDLR